MHPIPPYVVTTPYGTPGDWAAGYHTGDDYSTHGHIGVPVLASHEGRVIVAGNAWGSAYGLQLVTLGRLGLIQVGYCHLSAVAAILGHHVRPGQVVAYSGDSGRTTGPHLHYEERRPPFRYSDHRRPRFNHRA